MILIVCVDMDRQGLIWRSGLIFLHPVHDFHCVCVCALHRQGHERLGAAACHQQDPENPAQRFLVLRFLGMGVGIIIQPQNVSRGQKTHCFKVFWGFMLQYVIQTRQLQNGCTA